MLINKGADIEAVNDNFDPASYLLSAQEQVGVQRLGREWS